MKTPAKDIDIHLMDMMCGWFEFLIEEDSKLQSEEWNQRVFQLYQESAQCTEAPDREAFLRKFMNETVIPLIIEVSKEDEQV